MPAFAIYDLTGAEPNSRFENITGDTEATTRVGRVADLSGSGWDVSALDSDERPIAQTGYTEYTVYGEHRLASGALSFSGYVCIKFREDDFEVNGNCLIARGPDNNDANLVGERGNGEFRIYDITGGTELPAVTTSSGDHILELWPGTPMRYSLDGGPILEADDDWTEGLTRFVLGARNVSIAPRSWLGRIYRAVFWHNDPTETERGYIQAWVDGGDNLDQLTDVPPTPEELFKASFEDASGRDPLPTALRTREDARKLAGHNVLVYQYPPYVTDVTVPIATLDDYEKLTMGSDHWFKIPGEPLFKMGRWAKIQGRALRENALEVDLVLFTTDNPVCFVEPT